MASQIPEHDGKESAPIGAGELDGVTSTEPPAQTGVPENNASPKPEEAPITGRVPKARSVRRPVEPANAGDLPEPASFADPADPRKNGGEPSSEAFLGTLAGFLKASRAEVDALLARTREIQDASWKSVQSLLGQLHSELHQKMESASISFANDIGQCVQREMSRALDLFDKRASTRQATLVDDALARLQATDQRIETGLKESAAEHQHEIAERAAAALEGIRHEREGFDRSRTELEKTLEELQQRVVHEVDEHLQRTQLELADELRRRAEVGYEILNEQLQVSAKAVINETQHQIDALRQSSLATLTREACNSVQQQASLGAAALKEAADQTTASLHTYSQHSIEAFQKEIGDLFLDAVEKFHKTSESLLHDLQSRLDQAAQALRTINPRPTDTNQQDRD